MEREADAQVRAVAATPLPRRRVWALCNVVCRKGGEPRGLLAPPRHLAEGKVPVPKGIETVGIGPGGHR